MVHIAGPLDPSARPYAAIKDMWATLCKPWRLSILMWELLRNIGLIMFVTGGFVLLGLSTLYRAPPHGSQPELIRNIADGMMLGGACLAVIAMSMDYFLSDTATTLLTIP